MMSVIHAGRRGRRKEPRDGLFYGTVEEFGIPVPDQDLGAVGVAFIRVRLLYRAEWLPRAVS